MPMVFGFALQRRKLLEAEFLRIAGEMRQLGVDRFWLAGDLAEGRVESDSELELLVIREMDVPWRNRADFFSTHLRPRVGTAFWVYTPEEFERCGETDPLIRRTIALGDPVLT